MKRFVLLSPYQHGIMDATTYSLLEDADAAAAKRRKRGQRTAILEIDEAELFPPATEPAAGVRIVEKG